MTRLFSLRPLIFTWPYGLAFFVVALWVFLPERKLIQRRNTKIDQPDSPDRGSLKVILIAGRLGLIAAFVLAGWSPAVVPAAWRVPFFIAGLAIMIAGSVLRRHCFRVLGEFFTGDVRARADQPVVDRGAYRWIRHPSYTAGLLIFTGMGVALGNWLSIAVLLVATLLGYAYRVRVEEQALLAAIGEPYRRFMATRKRFIPFVF